MCVCEMEGNLAGMLSTMARSEKFVDQLSKGTEAIKSRWRSDPSYSPREYG